MTAAPARRALPVLLLALATSLTACSSDAAERPTALAPVSASPSAAPALPTPSPSPSPSPAATPSPPSASRPATVVPSAPRVAPTARRARTSPSPAAAVRLTKRQVVDRFLRAAARGDEPGMAQYASNAVVRGYQDRSTGWVFSDTCRGSGSGTCAYSFLSEEGGGFTYQATLQRFGATLVIVDIAELGGGA